MHGFLVPKKNVRAKQTTTTHSIHLTFPHTDHHFTERTHGTAKKTTHDLSEYGFPMENWRKKNATKPTVKQQNSCLTTIYRTFNFYLLLCYLVNLVRV